MFTKEKNKPLRFWEYQLPVVEEAGTFIHSSKFHRSASYKLYPYDYVMKMEAYAEYHVWSQIEKGWPWTERQICVIRRYPCPHDDCALRVQRLRRTASLCRLEEGEKSDCGIPRAVLNSNPEITSLSLIFNRIMTLNKLLNLLKHKSSLFGNKDTDTKNNRAS